jgi:hypothetical protein
MNPENRQLADLLSQTKGDSLKERAQKRVLLDSRQGLETREIVASQVSEENNLVVKGGHDEHFEGWFKICGNKFGRSEVGV